MRKERKDLLAEESNILAPYAVSSSDFGGREFPEEEHPYRLPFQRDRDRIIHCQSFKRLQYKTQVFIYSEGDHFRNRLTHTLEVAGISRTVARTLGLNADLAECIALAHDLGHSPFGHAGQDALSELMHGRGGFEHNKQSLRIVRRLERRYPDFPGLNLTKATLEGIMKHGGDYQSDEFLLGRKETGPSLEAQITDQSDELTYTVHDIEDGLERQILKEDELLDLSIWKREASMIQKLHPDLKGSLRYRTICRRIFDFLVTHWIESLGTELNAYSIRETQISAWKAGKKLGSFPPDLKNEVGEAKKFLMEKLYRHKEVSQKSEWGKSILEKLFHRFVKEPSFIPDSYRSRIEEEGIFRVVCDYISGMTDRYAESLSLQ